MGGRTKGLAQLTLFLFHSLILYFKMALYGGARNLAEESRIRPPDQVEQLAKRTLEVAARLHVTEMANALNNAALQQLASRSAPNDLRLLWRVQDVKPERLRRWLSRKPPVSSQSDQNDLVDWLINNKAPTMIRHGLPSVTCILNQPIDMTSHLPVHTSLRRADLGSWQLSLTLRRIPRRHRQPSSSSPQQTDLSFSSSSVPQPPPYPPPQSIQPSSYSDRQVVSDSDDDDEETTSSDEEEESDST